jgi:hypothetical protein
MERNLFDSRRFLEAQTANASSPASEDLETPAPGETHAEQPGTTEPAGLGDLFNQP